MSLIERKFSLFRRGWQEEESIHDDIDNAIVHFLEGGDESIQNSEAFKVEQNGQESTKGAAQEVHGFSEDMIEEVSKSTMRLSDAAALELPEDEIVHVSDIFGDDDF